MWVLSRVIGSGTNEDPYRAAIADLPGLGGYSAQIPSNDGTAALGWALCNVNPGTASVTSGAQWRVLFDHGVSLDAPLAENASAVKQMVSAYLGVNLVAGGASSRRSVLNQIGLAAGEGWFDESNLRVRGG